MEDFLNVQKRTEFKTHLTQFEAVIDHVSAFAELNAHDVTPTLSRDAVEGIKDDLEDFKRHVVNTDRDFFCAHRSTVYDAGKDTMHEIDELLHLDTISLQHRMTVLQAMTPGLRMCSGAVMTSLEEALQSLRLDGSGVKGVAYRTKAKIVEALVIDHVRENHRYGTSNEVHFVNHYFNIVAPLVGLPPREDPYVSIAVPHVTLSHIRDYFRKTFAGFTPEAVAMVMADDYLSKVKDEVVQRQTTSDLTGPVSADQLTALFEICKTVKRTRLDKEFGDVPIGVFVHAVAIRDGMAYQLTSQPIPLAQHFLQVLKGQELVDYQDTVNLSDDESQDGTLKMLGRLLWVDKEGFCVEAQLADLLKTSPKAIYRILTKNEDICLSQRYAILDTLCQQVVQITKQDSVASVPAVWIEELADLYHQDCKARQITPSGSQTNALANGTKVGDPSWSGPIAMLAAMNGHSQVLDALCGASANPNETCENGRSLAIHAAAKGYVAVLDVLFNRRANFNAQDHLGNSPILVATINGHLDTVKFLCAAGVDVDSKNIYGSTAVMEAATHGRSEVLRVLLAAGADIKSINHGGLSALMFAASRGHAEAIDILIEGGENMHAKDICGSSVLMYATAFDQVDVLKKLIEAGASVDTPDLSGTTPLMLAIVKGHTSSAEILVRFNAQLNVTNRDGKTALMIAVESNNMAAVLVLVKAGADLGIKDASDHDAASLAAYLGHTEIVDRLALK